MAGIQLTRSNEHVNRLRAINIYAGNKKIGDIKNGELEHFVLPAGKCILQARIDWCTSNKLMISPIEHQPINIELTSFANGSRPGGFSALYHITFGMNKFLKLRIVLKQKDKNFDEELQPLSVTD
jgi:hypothetical protein